MEKSAYCKTGNLTTSTSAATSKSDNTLLDLSTLQIIPKVLNNQFPNRSQGKYVTLLDLSTLQIIPKVLNNQFPNKSQCMRMLSSTWN